MHRILPLLPLALLLCACQTAEPGVTSGPLSQSARFPVGVTEAADATVATFKTLDFTHVQAQTSKLESKVTGKSAGKTAVADIDRISDEESQVTIRYGTLGDKPFGIVVLKAIGEELGTPPMTQPTP